MSATEPGGSLFQLPPEIREEIYSYCFRKSYLVFWPQYWYERKIIDRAILQVSKAVSSDVKHFLFTRAASKAITFKYKIVFDTPGFCTPPTKEATDRMMNVDFDVSVVLCALDLAASSVGKRLDRESIMGLTCAATVDRFAGAEVIRDNFRILLNFGGRYSEYYEFIESRFFQTLKNFSGFHDLIVVVRYEELFGTHLNTDDQERFIDLPIELEPHLGPCCSKILKHEHTGRRKYLILELKFHPLKFYVENLRAEAARLTKEADRLEGCELGDI